MKVLVHVEKDRLVVDVTVTNDLDEPLYLQHWLFDWYGLLGRPEMHDNERPQTAFWTRELAFVCLGSGAEVVLLNGEGPPPDPLISVFEPRRPASTRLMPRQTFRGSLRLPLPLSEWHAYSDLEREKVRPVTVTQLRYRLGTLRKSACVPVWQAPNAPGIFVAYGHPREILEATVPLPIPITVLQRMDDFQRFG